MRNNLFKSMDTIYSSISTKTASDSVNSCQQASTKNTIFLHGNPFLCDCENNWWSNMDANQFPPLFYVNKTFCLNISDYESLSCTSLSNEKTQLIGNYQEVSIKETGFKFQPISSKVIASTLMCPYRYACSPKTCECCEFRACDCAFYCPSQCGCTRDYARTFDMVNCTNVQLNLIPTYLPVSTTDLLLNGNNLKRIQPYQFFGRFNLITVDLSHNQIGFIEEKSFHGLTRLTTLKLSNNELQILLGFEFRDVLELETLLLDNNRIQFISNATFSYLTRLTHLDLKNNHLRHLLEYNMFFQLNPRLVSINIDASNTHLMFNSNSKEANKQTALKSNYFSAIADLLEANKTHDGNSRVYLGFIRNQIEKMNRNLSNRYELIECIYEKFRRLVEANTKPSKALLVKHLRKFKTACTTHICFTVMV